MLNVRVFQLARDLDLSSQEVIDRLKKLGVDVKTASSSIDEDTADKLKRALKIDALTARKRRIYGSEEDEAERELQEQAQAAKVAAEREARERAAAEAAAAAEVRKAKKGRGTRAEKEAEAAKAALKPAVEEPHAPGAPRLAPKVATPPPPEAGAARGPGPAAPASRQEGDRPRRGTPLSSTPAEPRAGAAESVAGLLAAASIFTSLIAVAWHPLRLVLVAILFALIAVGIGGRHARLAALAAGIGGLSFFAGMTS